MASKLVEIRSILQRAAATGALSNPHMTAEEQLSTRASGLALGSPQISVAVVRATSMVPILPSPICAFQDLWFKGPSHKNVRVHSHLLHPLQPPRQPLVVGSLAVVAFVAIHMRILHSTALMASSARIAELMHANAPVQDQAHHQVLALAVTAAGQLEVLSVEQVMAAFVGANAAVIAAGRQVDHSVERMMEANVGLLAAEHTWSFQPTQL